MPKPSSPPPGLSNAPSSISISDATANEDTGTISFTVSLSGASKKAISVDYTTVNGTASSSSDYTAASGTLSFDPGQTTKVVTISLTNDFIREGTENFSVHLSNAVNAKISDADGSATITDNDPNIIRDNPLVASEGLTGTPGVPDYFVFDFSGTTVLEDTINGFESGTDKIVGVNFGLGDAFQNLGNGFYITLGDGITNRIRVLSGDTIQETDYLTFSNDPFLLA
jgi:Calx-beta domain